MAGVRLIEVSKNFDGSVLAVDRVNLEIQEGEFVVLVGPSGCGKSTTLRMIAGLEDPTSGEIFIGNRVVNRVPPKDRDVSMVFQDYALYPHMSVYDNLAFGLKIRKTNRSEISGRVNEAARLLGLGSLLQKKPKTLSGGQRQRVALGRAIVRKPQVFLFDEPLSNLDAKLRVQMRAEISKLHRQLGTTMIYVTHDQVEAMTMADRIVVLHEGSVQQVASPDEIYRKPINQFTAGFMGNPPMNFIRGTLSAADGERGPLVFSSPLVNVRLESDSSERLVAFAGRAVNLGVRPEGVLLKTSEGDSGFSIELIEHLGNEDIVYLTFEDGTPVVSRASGNQTAEMHVSQKVGIEVTPSLIHFFDTSTGERL